MSQSVVLSFQFQQFVSQLDVNFIMPASVPVIQFFSSNRVVGKLRQLSLTEERVVKVVPDRIFSVTFHPSVEKMVVLVGGKWGELGEWWTTSLVAF